MNKIININKYTLKSLGDCIWRIEPFNDMNVALHLIASQEILERIKDDRSIEQAVNVAKLPGIIEPVLTMPDIHQGYGFPIGGVAAFNLKEGVISPGGVGYDINCGIRLLLTTLRKEEIASNLKNLVLDLFSNIPSGVGSKRKDLKFKSSDLEEVLIKGSTWAIKNGFGSKEDILNTESGGCIEGVDCDDISERAKIRGSDQLGTLGSGNHFIEIQVVDKVFDEKVAEVFGLFNDQIVVMIHTGSRGLGYQVCSDYLEVCKRLAPKYGIKLYDRELAAVPINSKEGQKYFSAMKGAANFAFANRQIITHWIREVFQKYFTNTSCFLLYDVCHNIAKIEEFNYCGKKIKACVHRKGATRAYGPLHNELPNAYREVGQPVLIPGDMGRNSYVLVGTSASHEKSFGSACHGAGRELSRTQAKKKASQYSISRELEEKGIFVKAASYGTLAEEIPEAYKDVTEVVTVTEKSSIAKVVARMKPLGVIKG